RRGHRPAARPARRGGADGAGGAARAGPVRRAPPGERGVPRRARGRRVGRRGPPGAAGGEPLRPDPPRRPRRGPPAHPPPRHRQGTRPGGCSSRGQRSHRRTGVRVPGRRGRRPVIVVAKIGTSSITCESGEIDESVVAKFCAEVDELRQLGHRVVIVTSGAIAAGLPALGLTARPRDAVTLQAASAVGQSRLMQVYDAALARSGLVAGQVLLAPLDFMVRQQYLHARSTLNRLLELGVVPVVNENDAIADDEIRFGDNDRLAALVAHLLAADLLVLLTDQPGLLSGDPRFDAEASLIEEIVEVDHSFEAMAGGVGSDRGSGGMASKLAAAKIAAWSGVRAVIAHAHRSGVLLDAVKGTPG